MGGSKTISPRILQGRGGESTTTKAERPAGAGVPHLRVDLGERVVINSRLHNVRALVWDRLNDPYILWHPDGEQLNDKHLTNLLVGFQELHGALDEHDSEKFEQFLGWLEEKFGYSQPLVMDSVFDPTGAAYRCDGCNGSGNGCYGTCECRCHRNGSEE